MTFSPHWQLLISHPLTLDLLQITTVAFVVAYTSATSIVRPAIFPVILVIPWYSIPTCSYRVYHSMWAGIIGSHSSTYLLQYIEIALLSKWSFESCGPGINPQDLRLARAESRNHLLETKNPEDKGQGTVWDRMRFGFSACFDSRMNGRPLEVKGVPPFSSSNPTYIPTRGEFLRRTIVKVSFSYLVLDILTASANPATNATVYSLRLVPFFSRLQEVSIEEVITRILTSTGLWASIYCMMQIMHSTVAILAVASGLSEVRTWRPLYGSLSEAYTIRQFWSNFWHQINRQRFSSPSFWFTYSFLHLRKGSLFARYLFCALVFLISGLQHATTDVAEGMSWSRSGSVQFFMTQFMGIVLEDAAQEIWRRVRGKPGGRGVRLLSYMWVLAFHAWSVPAWIYPSLVDNRGEKKDMIVPFSVVSLLHKMKS